MLAVSGFVFLRRPRDPAARALFRLGALLPLGLTAYPYSTQVIDVVTGRRWPLVVGDTASLLMWGAVLHFTLVVPRPRGVVERHPAVAAAAAYGLPVVLYAMHLAQTLPDAANPLARAGLLVTISVPAANTVPFVAGAVMVASFWLARDAGTRQRLLWVFFAFGAGFAAYILLGRLPERISGAPFVPWDWQTLFFLPVPVAVAAGVLRHRLWSVSLSKLIDHIRHRPGGAYRGARTTVYDDCVAEIEAERRIAQIRAGATPARPAAPPPSPNGSAGTAVLDGGDGAARAARLVERDVAPQMDTVTSPKEEMRVAVKRRSDQDDRKVALESFELRDGPSDVTAYHDFSTLKIAFQPVWTELFDGRLRSIGEQLYQEYVRLKDFLGADDGVDHPVKTPGDLAALADASRKLGESAQSQTPKGLWSFLDAWSGGLMGSGPSGYGTGMSTSDNDDATTPTYTDGSRLQRLLSDLDELLAERYAFDVFATDSINFGFIVTYRQTWVLQQYQVGDLVPTIPLAPNEVRRHTTRKVVKKTRSVKELEALSRGVDAAAPAIGRPPPSLTALWRTVSTGQGQTDDPRQDSRQPATVSRERVALARRLLASAGTDDG